MVHYSLHETRLCSDLGARINSGCYLDLISHTYAATSRSKRDHTSYSVRLGYNSDTSVRLIWNIIFHTGFLDSLHRYGIDRAANTTDEVGQHAEEIFHRVEENWKATHWCGIALAANVRNKVTLCRGEISQKIRKNYRFHTGEVLLSRQTWGTRLLGVKWKFCSRSEK